MEMQLEMSSVSGIYIKNIQQAVWLSHAIHHYLNLKARNPSLFPPFQWKLVF